jgi:hypothetical protein
MLSPSSTLVTVGDERRADPPLSKSPGLDLDCLRNLPDLHVSVRARRRRLICLLQVLLLSSFVHT